MATVTVAELDRLPAFDAAAALQRCCGSRRWVDAMVAARPFGTEDRLLAEARRIWRGLEPGDWREAFAHHPRVGDLQSLRTRFASTADWSHGEQSGVAAASEAVLAALAQGNRRYEERFGYIFIVCATGLSADQMLQRLEERLPHGPDTEVVVAAEEQIEITRLRLLKLIGISE